MSESFNTFTNYLHDVFVTQFDGWVILGFVAQGFFTMRFVEGFSEAEIAKRLDLNVSTVKTRAYRARAHLRRQLAARLGEPIAAADDDSDALAA